MNYERWGGERLRSVVGHGLRVAKERMKDEVVN